MGVGAVVVDEGRVLLVRRGREPLKGQWSLPGGMLELGEGLTAGVVREVREETGLKWNRLNWLSCWTGFTARASGFATTT